MRACDHRRTPLLGWHPDRVLRDRLGLDARDVQALRERGIVAEVFERILKP